MKTYFFVSEDTASKWYDEDHSSDGSAVNARLEDIGIILTSKEDEGEVGLKPVWKKEK